MKTLITILGIIMLAGGIWLVYNGYETKQTTSALIEKEVSTAIRRITDDTVRTGTDINTESNLKMAGGAAAAIAGMVLVVAGMRRSKRKR